MLTSSPSFRLGTPAVIYLVTYIPSYRRAIGLRDLLDRGEGTGYVTYLTEAKGRWCVVSTALGTFIAS